MVNKRTTLFFNILILFFTVIYFIVLFLNIDYFKVPHGDIYQYISDAKHYSNLEFPWLIQLQPLTPILIALLRPLFSEFNFPYFATAKFLNILAASGTLVFTYLIIKKHLNSKIAFLIALLCSIHPLTILNSLDITTVGLYAFFAIGALYFIDRNKKMFFIMTTLAFLVRIEGIILLAVYVINKLNFKKLKENFNNKNYKDSLNIVFKENIDVFVFLFFSIAWTIFQTIHNIKYDFTPYGNQYLNEMSSMTLRVENFVYVFGLIGAFFFPKTFIWWGIDLLNPGLWQGALIVSSLFFLVVSLFLKKTRIYGFYILMMALIHSFFPAIEYRYFFLFLNLFVINIAIIFHELYLRTKQIFLKFALQLITVFIAIFWIVFSIDQLNKSLLDYREIGLDLYYSASEWLFDSMENGEYYIFAEKGYLYSNIFLNSKKYLKTKNSVQVETDEMITKITIDEKILNFINLPVIKKKCENIACLFEIINPEKGAKYILITHQWSKDQEKDFWWNFNGLSLIEELLKKEDCLQDKITFKHSSAYRKINFFDKNCYLEKIK